MDEPLAAFGPAPSRAATSAAGEPLGLPVYFVGQGFAHHAGHSGYLNSVRRLGTHLAPPVRSRQLRPPWGTPVNGLVARLAGLPTYTPGALITEAAAALHMRRTSGAIYHVLFGDRDLWLLARVKRGHGARLVATFHQPPAVLAERRIGRSLTGRLDAIILVSASQREFFAGHLPPERIRVVPHGVDTGFFHPAETGADGRVCITVGCFLRDFETLAAAIERVWRHDPGVRFVAVGTEQFRRSALHRLEDARLALFGNVSDERLRDLYRTAKVAVFSLREATANNSVLEAMASGLPVVATDTGGVREYVGDRAGVLCPPRDPEALAAAVGLLLGADGRRAAMSRAARERALEFDHGRVAGHLRRTYQEIVALDAGGGSAR
jgi:glycosyltransferase involved in cell wall biosynthesis